MGNPLRYPEVTRVTVIGHDGVAFERYNLYVDGAEVHIQDEGRTIKIFPMSKDTSKLVVGEWGWDSETHTPIHIPSYNLGKSRTEQ